MAILCALLVPSLARAQSDPPTAAASPPPANDDSAAATESAPATLSPVPEPGARPVPPPPPPRHAAAGTGHREPSIALETPAPTAAPLRTYRTHDGFYLRLGLGLGSLALSVDPKNATLPSLSASSTAVAFDALVGGTPARGLAIGGALLVDAATANQLDVGGHSTNEDVTLTTGILGAFVDGFPDPHGGLDLGGAIGVASAVLDRKSADDFRGGGVGFAGWVGYAAWIGSEWSLGGTLRVYGALARDTTGDGFTGRSSGISLTASALFH